MSIRTVVAFVVRFGFLAADAAGQTSEITSSNCGLRSGANAVLHRIDPECSF